MNFPLDFQHRWQDIFWLWGISQDEIPLEHLSRFHEKFGYTWNESDPDHKLKFRAWLFLLLNTTPELMNKLLSEETESLAEVRRPELQHTCNESV